MSTLKILTPLNSPESQLSNKPKITKNGQQITDLQFKTNQNHTFTEQSINAGQAPKTQDPSPTSKNRRTTRTGLQWTRAN